MALYWPTLQFYVWVYVSFVCQYVPPRWVILQYSYYVEFFFHRWVRFLYAVRVFEVRASSSSTKLPLCQLCFAASVPTLAHEDKSCTQSLNRPAYLIRWELKLALRNHNISNTGWQRTLTQHTHCNCSLPSARMAGYQDCPTRNLAFSYNFQYNTSSTPSRHLSNHTLWYFPSFQSIIQPQATNMRVSTCMYNTTSHYSLINYYNKHPNGCDSQLPWKCLFTSILFRQAILTHEVGQTDIVFGVWWGCISRSVHARL